MVWHAELMEVELWVMSDLANVVRAEGWVQRFPEVFPLLVVWGSKQAVVGLSLHNSYPFVSATLCT